MKHKISITTIILGVTLSKLYAKGNNDTLVEVISAFRASLKSDGLNLGLRQRVPSCDLELVELARGLRSDYGYLIEVA